MAEGKDQCSVCPKLKEVYENCYRKWLSDSFLKGKATQIGCEEEYSRYQKCIKDFMLTDKSLKEELAKSEKGEF
ncbi:hypothetical protein MHBO_000283 [Bonamia ostreae]|uniref:Mitochondrial distribution and morphology protein 35 n=1 Tax=Bonamia ostreae TaxID=126728 RepID=A0ABV2AF31_9EUKA